MKYLITRLGEGVVLAVGGTLRFIRFAEPAGWELVDDHAHAERFPRYFVPGELATYIRQMELGGLQDLAWRCQLRVQLSFGLIFDGQPVFIEETDGTLTLPRSPYAYAKGGGVERFDRTAGLALTTGLFLRNERQHAQLKLPMPWAEPFNVSAMKYRSAFELEPYVPGDLRVERKDYSRAYTVRCGSDIYSALVTWDPSQYCCHLIFTGEVRSKPGWWLIDGGQDAETEGWLQRSVVTRANVNRQKLDLPALAFLETFEAETL